MKLFVDTIDEENSIQIITEAVATGGKNYFIEGIYAQAENKNRNGRVYPKGILEKAVTEFEPMVKARRALGELNHPASPSINPERASHLITKLEWSDNNVTGRSKILTSLPMGKIAQGLIDEKVSFGISTRGLGTVTESSGTKIVQDNYKIVTFDLVSDPSGIDCWVNGLMENAEWIFDVKTGSWIIAEEIKKEVSGMSRKTLVEQKLRLFEKFLTNIR